MKFYNNYLDRILQIIGKIWARWKNSPLMLYLIDQGQIRYNQRSIHFFKKKYKKKWFII